jgi:5'-nucleotidase
MMLRFPAGLTVLVALWLGCASAGPPANGRMDGGAARPAEPEAHAASDSSTERSPAPGARADSLAPAPGAEEGPCAGLAADSLIHLTVLATNDLHGALESKVYPWSEAGRPVGGAATLAAYIARERAANPDGTLLLDGGDLMQGTAISNLTQGESVIEYYDAVGYDAAAIGNHEFDWGIEVLEKRIAQARFAWLSANIERKADGTRPPWALPTATVRRKGLVIGIVGVTTRSTPTTTLPEYVADMRFTDLAEAVRTRAVELERAGADLIFVVAHAGGYFNPDSNSFSGEIVDAMRRMPSSVDLVVSGHSHTLLDGRVNGIPLVQARSRGTAMAIVQLWVDARTRDVACSDAEVETIYGDRVEPDSAVGALVERYRDQMGPSAERVIAEAAHPLTADRRRESALGDLIADAQRAATGSQIALTNSGGIRAEIDAGPIRWREVFEVQPFANPLYRLEISGSTLKEALENGVSGERGLVQVSGVRFTVDPAAPVGRRVSDLSLENGKAVQPGSTYSVTVNNFMAQGGDGYAMLQEAAVAEDTGIIDLDAFIHFLERLPQPIQNRPRGRIRFLGDALRANDAR